MSEVRKCKSCGKSFLLPSWPMKFFSSCPFCGKVAVFCVASLRGNRNAVTVAVPALILLIAAFNLPFMTIISFGEENVYSLIGGIRKLYSSGSIGLALILFIFSVLFPFLKIFLIIVCTSRIIPINVRMRHIFIVFAEMTGKYSMLDVFVIAIMVILIKMKGTAEVLAEEGTFIFVAAVLLTMLAANLVDFREGEKNEK